MKPAFRTSLRTVFALLLSSVALVSAPAASQAATMPSPAASSTLTSSTAITRSVVVPPGGFTSLPATTTSSSACSNTAQILYPGYDNGSGGFVFGCGFGVNDPVTVDVYSPSGTRLSEVLITSRVDTTILVTDFGIVPCQSYYVVQAHLAYQQFYSNKVQIGYIGCLT